MKTKVDLVKGWLRKAESDLLNARICMEAGQALDTECFHAQQAAEKYIKAYLTEHEIDSLIFIIWRNWLSFALSRTNPSPVLKTCVWI